MYKLFGLFLVATSIFAHDISLGKKEGHKIFDEVQTANPAIWRQINKVTVNATQGEIITAVIITDKRKEKDGEAQIVEGGIGQNNVTLELRSPTVFRGYEFEIVIYANKSGEENNIPAEGTTELSVDIPRFIAKENTDVSRGVEDNKSTTAKSDIITTSVHPTEITKVEFPTSIINKDLHDKDVTAQNPTIISDSNKHIDSKVTTRKPKSEHDSREARGFENDIKINLPEIHNNETSVKPTTGLNASQSHGDKNTELKESRALEKDASTSETPEVLTPTDFSLKNNSSSEKSVTSSEVRESRDTKEIPKILINGKPIQPESEKKLETGSVPASNDKTKSADKLDVLASKNLQTIKTDSNQDRNERKPHDDAKKLTDNKEVETSNLDYAGNTTPIAIDVPNNVPKVNNLETQGKINDQKFTPLPYINH